MKKKKQLDEYSNNVKTQRDKFQAVAKILADKIPVGAEAVSKSLLQHIGKA